MIAPIPKPGNKKKNKLYNGYKDKADRFCYYCKTPYAERHEVYGGSNRQISIANKFQVDLCPTCHREMTENITDRAKERNTYWKRFFQKQYEDKLICTGIRTDQARGIWLSMIGRNYL